MDYCSEKFIEIYRLIGIIILIFKLFIPLIIIVYGTFDIFMFIIKIKNKESKERLKLFLKRIIAGVVIFFIPNIILTIFESIGFNKDDYACMYNCTLDITKCNNINDNNNN